MLIASSIFKPVPQSATLPPDNAAEERNGSNPSHASPLSPFASLLLKNTAICFTGEFIGLYLCHILIWLAPGTQANEPPRKPTAMQHTVPKSEIRAAPQPQSADLDSTATPQNANRAHQSSVHSQTPRSTPVQPGPAVLIQPKVVRKDEYQLFDNIVITEPSSQKKESRKADSDAAFLRPHEREIADRKIEELQSFVSRLSEDKEDLDPSGSFSKVSTDDGELTVLQSRFMDLLSDKMSNVINLGRFAVLPVDLVMKIQSLLEPSITCTGHSALSLQDEDWSDSLDKAKSALTASKLVLSSMIEGSDDYRIRREDIIGVIIDLIKAIKNDCIVPIIQSRRSDSSDGVHEAAMAHRKGLMVVLRQCGIVLSRFATLIGKVNLPDRALNVMEDLTLGLLVEQNSDSEKDSVFGIQKFEQFRQKAMDVLAQIFARHAEQRTSILNGILSNLEKLPDKKASARQFKSAREAPIMSISALFMRFVQVAATNRENPTKGVSADTNEQAHTEEGIDYEPGTSLHGEVKRAKNKNSPSRMAQDLTRNANHIAGIITSSLVDRASNVSKTGDKPFRNLLDLFIEDFCNVLGSPEWPAAAMLLSALLIRMATMVQGENSAKQSVVDKDMALSTMAKMGCGVIDFKHRLKLLKRTLDISQSNLSAKLDRLMDDVLTDHAKESIHSVDLYAFDGPYRIVIESLRDYLDMQHGQEDPHLQSVTGCHVTLWLDAVIRTFPIDDADIPQPEAVKAVQSHLESMFADSKWLSRK
jgi:cohesin loading factor subunit SCC2